MMKRLLVVDDSRGVRTFLQHHLSPYYQIQLASDGQQGLELAKEQHFDLVLSDINLPHLTGIELYAALKGMNPLQPVVLMTDADIDAYLADALKGHIGNIIAKATFKADMDGTVRLLQDLEQRMVFGMERRLGPGGEVRTYVVGAEEEVPDVLKQCHRILDRFPRRDVYRRLLPELVQNALAHGRSSKAGLYHRGGHYIRISVGADWQRVGLGVSDPGGNLSHRKTLNWLLKELKEDPEGRAGGQGLLLCRRSMDQTFINILPGVQTEILCFDLLQGYQGPRSLHINELVSGRPLH
jgi:CheY-like chemotaxis protein